jgi:hypothetical protein
MRDLTDRLIELLLQNVHKMSVKAEKRVDQALLADFKRVTGKPRLLFQMAAVSLAHPAEPVQEVIYPVVGVQTLRDLVTEGAATGHFYRDKVHLVMRGSYCRYYRRLVPHLLDALTFRSNNNQHQTVIEALELLQQYAGSKRRFYGPENRVALEGVVPPDWRTTVVGQDAQGHTRINRINYEMHVLHTLRERLRCKEIWVEGAYRYRNPEEDLPMDFAEERPAYYQALEKPLDPEAFITRLQHHMHQALQTLDTGMPQNLGVWWSGPAPWMSIIPHNHDIRSYLSDREPASSLDVLGWRGVRCRLSSQMAT